MKISHKRPTVAALALAVFTLTACSTSQNALLQTPQQSVIGTPNETVKPGSIQKILFIGDSIAEQEQPALAAALATTNITFNGEAQSAGSLVVPSGEVDKKIQIVNESPSDLVILQQSVLDLATAQEQKSQYQKFAEAVKHQKAKLLIVQAPPVKMISGDVWQGETALAQLKSLDKISSEIAQADPHNIHYMKTNNIWGDTFSDQKASDGRPLRSGDGVHLCPTGVALFTDSLLNELHHRFGVPKIEAGAWVPSDWTRNKVYDRFSESCRS